MLWGILVETDAGILEGDSATAIALRRGGAGIRILTGVNNRSGLGGAGRVLRLRP